MLGTVSSRIVFFVIVFFYALTGMVQASESEDDPRLVREINHPRAYIIKALHEVEIARYKNFPELILSIEKLRDIHLNHPQKVTVITQIRNKDFEDVYKVESPLGPDKAPTKVTYYLRSKNTGSNLAASTEGFFSSRTHADHPSSTV